MGFKAVIDESIVSGSAIFFVLSWFFIDRRLSGLSALKAVRLEI
jgi:hypothetical protein